MATETIGRRTKVEDVERGVYKKFEVRRIDGRSNLGEKHEKCEYFVLDLTHDPHAKPALMAYAESCRTQYPQLAEDLLKAVETGRLFSTHLE